jgi:cytochrome bd-type quinol oxidase subunit 1
MQHCVQWIALTILNATFFFFFEASNVIVFDFCLDPLQRDFDIHCANNVFFYAQASSFFVLVALSSSIGYLNMCTACDYILVNY